MALLWMWVSLALTEWSSQTAPTSHRNICTLNTIQSGWEDKIQGTLCRQWLQRSTKTFNHPWCSDSATIFHTFTARHNGIIPIRRWSNDIKLGYLQSTEPLRRRVFIANLSSCFELEPHQCFKLLRPLYGLCYVVDLLAPDLAQKLSRGFGTWAHKSWPVTVFFSALANWSVSTRHVTDLLRTRDSEFRKKCPKTHQTFETSANEPHLFTSSGFNVSVTEDASLSIDLNFYWNQL